MDRKVYITDDVLSLAEYIRSVDNIDSYRCWQDEATQKGYNFKLTETLEEYNHRPTAGRSRFCAVIIRNADHAHIGEIFVSPEGTPPDLAIMLYKPYRYQGYGTTAFSLGVRYCFDTLALDKIYAGCYEDNIASMKMLKKCGFQPHPEGDVLEKHYLTGEPITQFDFVKHNEKRGSYHDQRN